jgi:hypothetical protein
MFAAVLVFAIVAMVVRLAAVVGNDRAQTTPRSHTHELDPRPTRLRRIV